MVSNASADLWQRLTDGSRHATIQAAWRRLFVHAIDGWSITLLFAAAVVAWVVKPGRRGRWFESGICMAVLIVSLAGAYFAYLLGAADLPSWLAQGSDRIFMQVWPVLVMGVAVALPSWATINAWITPPPRYDVPAVMENNDNLTAQREPAAP